MNNKLFVPALAAVSCCELAPAAEPTMTKIVSRMISEFFCRHQAKSAGIRIIEGNPCNGFSIYSGDGEIKLRLRPDGKTPRRLDFANNNRSKFSVNYLVYEVNLPFQASMFAPLKGVSITEAG
jgi:hypothetical protein